ATLKEAGYIFTKGVALAMWALHRKYARSPYGESQTSAQNDVAVNNYRPFTAEELEDDLIRDHSIVNRCH
ncbi:hypothetical protein PENTCL1PPCAC_26172, partial [Pristionchus entomophagus]